MDGEDLVAVLGFLRDKGFVATELALQEEQTRLSAITNNPQVPRRRYARTATPSRAWSVCVESAWIGRC
jgi:hypothetical protein